MIARKYQRRDNRFHRARCSASRGRETATKRKGQHVWHHGYASRGSSWSSWGIVSLGAGAYAYLKVQNGAAALQGFSDAHRSVLSYNDEGQLVDRGSTEGAAAIMALLRDDWQWPVEQSELNPDDPVTNTATEYMYQMATIAHHTLDGTQTVVLTEPREWDGDGDEAIAPRARPSCSPGDGIRNGRRGRRLPARRLRGPCRGSLLHAVQPDPPAGWPRPRAGMVRTRPRPLRRARRRCDHRLQPAAGSGRRRRRRRRRSGASSSSVPASIWAGMAKEPEKVATA